MMRLQLNSSVDPEVVPQPQQPQQPAAASSSASRPQQQRDTAGTTRIQQEPLSESNDLMGNSLASYFSQLFEKPQNEPSEKGKEKKKCKKCKKAPKGKDKRKQIEPLAEFQPPTLPEVSVPRTPSSFAVFAAIRATCLEDRLRQAALLQLQSAAAWKEVEEGDASDLSPDENFKKEIVLPKIVSIGLLGVFEIIREAQLEFPKICKKALESLLNILQGLQPEELVKEPVSATEPMFQTLLDLASADEVTSDLDDGQHVRALACACLLSFSVALGDTGKLLQASSAMLMSPKGLEKIVMPSILVNLQRSVTSVMMGKTDHPNVMSQGLPTNSNLDEFDVTFPNENVPKEVHSMVSDGAFIYLHTSHGLFKIGSGYSGTVKGRTYQHQPNFNPDPGWLGIAEGQIYFKPHSHLLELYRVSRDTLAVQDLVSLDDEEDVKNPYHMLSDGKSLGAITVTNRESFKVRFLNVGTKVATFGQELPLKLARKCVDCFGVSVFQDGDSNRQIDFGCEEEVYDLRAGKEFAFMLSGQGKLFFSGKPGCIGQKQSFITGKWSEISLSRAPRLSQVAIGHDGQHALLLTDDGAVYFTGTARRGEDGDQSKNRRQPKPVKPKKFARVDGISISQVACNNGTSAMVSKDGDVYVFGKDSSHADISTGIVTDLKGTVISQIALGKAHIVALTKSGEVFTFGMNNKGQCGRDFPGGREGSVNNDNLAPTDSNIDDTHNSDTENEQAGLYSICAKDRHTWKHEQCMVCVLCGECTGYGSSCVSSGRPDRNPGMLCGCGSGDSGCSDCGICRNCAGDEADNLGAAIEISDGGAGVGDAVLPAGADNHFDVLAGSLGHSSQELRVKHRARVLAAQERKNYKQKLIRRSIQKIRNGSSRSRRHADRDEREAKRDADGQSLKSVELRNREKNYLSMNNQSGGASDVEKEAGKLTSLAPAKISLPRDIKITNICCGLHHTLLLSSKGEVFVFGSNTHGQLGLGDLIPRGAPTKLVLPVKVTAIAAGSYHSVLLSTSGEVYTFGSYQKGQLGRDTDCASGALGGAVSAEEIADRELWFAKPKIIETIGAKLGRTATWIGASTDQTFIKVDESLINAQSLLSSSVMATKQNILLIPSMEENNSFSCLSISREDGFCKSFRGSEQEFFGQKILHADSVFNILWAYDQKRNKMKSYLAMMNDFKDRSKDNLPTIISPELALPCDAGGLISRNQASLNLLSCLDTLNQMPDVSLTGLDEDTLKTSNNKTFTKEDFLVINRFDSHGGGWGYSGHSIEAIRFMVDTDILLGGYGLFGGRGEYIGKIKLFDIGNEGGDQESDGELLAESEEITYECGARQKYPILFDEPVSIQAGRWYIAWARVSGPSSDCGSSGQTQVTTEDQIQFNFKSSKKSNNGTDVNAGQVPQLLYKIITADHHSKKRRPETMEPICILSKKFSRTVTAECFNPLLSLIQWSWNAFKVGLWDLVEEDNEYGSQAILLDLERFIYIARACLRLLVIFTHEVYPCKIIPNQTKPVPETQRLAETVYETRILLQQILQDPIAPFQKAEEVTKFSAFLDNVRRMSNTFLTDTHRTFVACFHAFYPTGYLKWACLCNLLASMESSFTREGLVYDRLLAAVLDSLCQPMIKLRNTFPITYSPETETRCKNLSPTENLSITTSMIQACDNSSQRFPILTELMNYQSHLDGVRFASWSFREVLDRLLSIVSQPVKQALKGEPILFSQDLEEKACHVISAVISELANQTVSSDSDIQTLGGRILHISPNRFTRTSNSRTWNTGNGSPDAICFTVDKPGVFIVGCTVYGGMGTYDYELELLDDQSSSEKDPGRQSQRWNSLEIAHGSYSSDDCVGDIAEIKFEKAVAIKQQVKYALRLRNHGGRTSNGDGGISAVKGPDGTNFTFSSCSLSFNGTNPTRGQLPQLLYFSSPQETNDVQSSTKSMAELYSKRTALSMTSTIVKTLSNLLVNARECLDEKDLEILNSAPIITSMMPHVLASIANLTKQDPHSSVQILSFIQDLLPSVASLNNLASLNDEKVESDENGINTSDVEQDSIPTPHYAWVESDHPYKPASVSNYRVNFPPSVHWMSIEFDAQSATAQMEDVLQIYIRSPARSRQNGSNSNLTKPMISSSIGAVFQPQQEKYTPVLSKLQGSTNWPKEAVILPGNEILFSLETASDYIRDEKASNYGFKCLVVGYEAVYQRDQGLKNLEMELSYLGGLCSTSLMKRNLQLSMPDDNEAELEGVEESAKEAFEAHSTLLNKGFALEHAPSVQMALDGIIPFSFKSNEMIFLRNFVQCMNDTSGGRLARWLQPESFVDVDQCRVVFRYEDMRCNWPTVVTVVTQDQYGDVVHVPNMRVEVKAVPEDDHNRSCMIVRKATEPDALTFGGLAPPNLDTKYEVTVKDKMFYHAITVSKQYDNYSFEELRFASPALQRQSENMMVRANNDGSYSANWTPGNIGFYRIHVTVDGTNMSETFQVEVKDPPQGVVPPPHGSSKKTCGPDNINRLRKFIAKPSAGLRIRIHPTLQSEQIGIVPVDGTVLIVDEIQNSDGIWVRLAPETMAEETSNHIEGWCLQYNQHLEKTLMIPVADIKDHHTKDLTKHMQPGLDSSVLLGSSQHNPFQPGPFLRSGPSSRARKSRSREPGRYTVIKCGASGHNIRSKPNLSAAPIGMMNLHDVIHVVSVKVEAGETWVQLDQESMEKHCFSFDGDAWSLAISSNEIQYLQSEVEIEEEKMNIQLMGQPMISTRSPYGTSIGGTSVSGIPKPRPRIDSLPRRRPEKRSSPIQFDFVQDVEKRPTPPPRHSLRRESSPMSAGDGKKPSFFSKLFKVEGSRRGASSSPPVSRKASSPGAASMFVNKDIPPELQGVSVKELVKVIGESRANGNGVTPPDTPNSTRKANSRSLSPKVSRSASSSPVSFRSGPTAGVSSLPMAVAGTKSNLTQSMLSCEGSGLARRDSSQSDTSALVSSLTRDLSQSPGSYSYSPLSASGKSENFLHQRNPSKSPQTKPKFEKCLQEKNASVELPLKDSPESLAEKDSELNLIGSKESDSTPTTLSTRKMSSAAAKTVASVKQILAEKVADRKPKVEKAVVKEAMSPSLAESIRSVFAAFIWHEGIVHDAMAVASYLKFHPKLTEKNNLTQTVLQAGEQVDTPNENEQKKKMDLVRKQRHSVEVISMSYLKSKVQILDPQLMGKATTNANTNRNLAKQHQMQEIMPEQDNLILHQTLHQIKESNLPPTMKLLRMLWEQIQSYCRHAVLQQVIINSPIYASAPKKSDLNKSGDRDRKSKKIKRKISSNALYPKRDVPWVSPFSSVLDHSKLVTTEKEAFFQLCDICGNYFQHPVTYHMRLAHPGCGSPAGGKGYNSGGNYCGGWAGNCGDGGVGGSSWYLICEKCRDEHIKNAVTVPPPPTLNLGKDEKISTDSKLKPFCMSSSMKLLSPTGQMNSHNIMNSNAMFLLDLSSASNSNLIPSVQRRRSALSESSASSLQPEPSKLATSSNLSAVSELSLFDPNPFPLVPFQCFNSLGVQSNKLKLINDELVLDESYKKVPGEDLQKGKSQIHDSISPPAEFKEGEQENEVDGNKNEQNPTLEGQKTNAGSPSRKPFCRSVSVGCGPTNSQWSSFQSGNSRLENMPIEEEESLSPDSKNRKRNSSFENGSSAGEQIKDFTKDSTSRDFLSNPSQALQKLFDISSSQIVTSDILRRPVMSFVLQWNDLESIQLAMSLALRKASCRTFAIQALNWLLRSVSHPACLHDLLWFFVAALESKPSSFSVLKNKANDEKNKDKRNMRNSILQGDALKQKEKDQLTGLCDHPTADIYMAGEAVQPLQETFHSLLQTVSDLMLLLPVGSALQQIAIRCWGIKFKASDHHFLHQSHVFSTISQILSRSDELDNVAAAGNNTQNNSLLETGECVEKINDITSETEIKVSSRPAMINSLNDNSTETFWESGDEDRNKTKWVSVGLANNSNYMFSNICVHIDNGRDLGNKVSSVNFKSGLTAEDAQPVKQIDVESRFAGWLTCFFNNPDHKVVKIELKGPDNSLRLRQIKVLGEPKVDSIVNTPLLTNNKISSESFNIQQRNCEAETLRVFRLITGQVFGRLLEESHLENEANFKEHVVGILFSRSKLTHLQKQVCSHIVLAIQKESSRFRDDWEVSLCSAGSALSCTADDFPHASDTYCFEMLSLVMALSGSTVGRSYLAQQYGLIKDLLGLLHTGSGRIQRQVILLLRRVLPKIPPQNFAHIFGISNLPPKEFGILTSLNRSASLENDKESKPSFDIMKPGIIDMFLGCIAKALTLQVKSKQKVEGAGSRNISNVSLGSSIHPRENVGERWWLRGSMSKRIAEDIISLLKDMSGGKLNDEWALVTKSAVAENILNLTRLEDQQRRSEECLKLPTIWLALSSLCVLDKDHVTSLSSGDWSNVGEGNNSPRPTCENHDDGETLAIILCDHCGNLCGDCDRYLHLNRKTKDHQRQIFKEEEDSIKVDLHEGCGRTKLFWLMALADSLTLKAMVEFKESNGPISKHSTIPSGGNLAVCRFCSVQSSPDTPVLDSVCTDKECIEYSKLACQKTLPCGHFCGGIVGEDNCMPCLHGCNGVALKQDADDMCMICFTEALSPVPSILLGCGHVFHYNCCALILEKRWIGPRITFGFRNCPICKTEIVHDSLKKYLDPIETLYDDVKKKSLMRLEYEGISKCEAITSPGARYFNDPASFALNRYAYYVCFKCNKAYYGGEAQCDADAGQGDDFNPEELVCGGCSDVSRAQMCPKHGTDYLEYKCRYCCSVAVFFCFGTTHFCNACHDDFQRVANLPKQDLPQCPVGPKCVQLDGDECPLHVKHPSTGEEFALGCGVCRNAHTF